MNAIHVLELAPSLDVFYDLDGAPDGSPRGRPNGRPNGPTNGHATGLTLGEGVSTIATGSKFRPASRQHPGGKGINVARVLARLTPAGGARVPVVLHLFCQDGPLARALVAWLAAEPALAGRVAVAHHAVGADSPRVCANATVTLGGRMAREFNFSPYVGVPEDQRDALLAEVAALDRRGAWVVLAGTPPSRDGGIDELLYRDVVAALPRTKVVLDTSGPALDRCLTARLPNLALVKINQEEAAQSAEALPKFRGLTVVTREGGAELFRGARRVGAARVARPPAVKCTLGAGDSVTAGFLVHYLATGDAPASLRFGEAVALALVTSRAGIRGITTARVLRKLADLEIS